MWTDEEVAYLRNLTENAPRNRWKQWTKEMNADFDTQRNWEQLRAYWRMNIRNVPAEREPEYREEVQILGNGDVKSDKLVEMSLQQAKDPQYILEAHGFDPREFELTNAKSSQWNHSNKEHGTSVKYASKITVKPIHVEIDYEEIIELLEDSKTPYEPKTPYIVVPKKRYINVPSFDTHFDGNTLDGYRESLSNTLSYISDGSFEESLLILGGDIVHVDSIKNTTTRGTQMETTDIAGAFDEMEEYYESIIETMLQHSKHTHIMQLNGNHDNTLGYAFARVLKKAYSRHENISFDIDLKQRKATMLGNNMIGGSHGDKAKAKYPQLFATEFAQMWASATNRELFTGHLHHETVKDDGGMLHRQMPTRKEPDTWHKENGFTMASDRFQLVTYTEDTTEKVIYV